MADVWLPHERHPVTGQCVWCGVNSTSSVGCKRGQSEPERLRAQLDEARRGLAAWEALCDAFRFHEPYKTLDAQPGYRCHAGDPGPDRQWRYLAYGNGPTKTLAVVSLATKLGLIPEAK
jgi:hypothetical protein